VAYAGRPVFLKVVYHGPKAMEDLVAWDPHLVVGILGGGAGTTYDAFKLISEAQKYGARVALYGRKINNAECQLAFVEFLRMITDRVISPEEAVKAYHGVLEHLRIKPQRKLEDDLVLQTGVMSYGGGSTVTVPAGVPAKPAAKPAGAAHGDGHHACSCPTKPSTPAPAGHDCGCKHKTPAAAAPAATLPADDDENPDFKRMTQAQKLAWNQRKRDKLYGKFGT
jgi:hypothetical protein